MTDTYTISPSGDDGRPVDERSHYVVRNGFPHHMRKSKRSAQWVAARMNKGEYVPDDHELTPEQIREMEEDHPE